ENKQEKKTEEIPEEIKDILEQRKQARESKDWKTSDELRDRLKELGFSVRDSKDGQTVEKI
ncbi:MAG TPA: cysteine--tRNA ligase, partial [Candidatus Merdicola faecigallinarum]|nr:cysteine--tRNA ligase [Candidatus Merdicola faecigallinarum]